MPNDNRHWHRISNKADELQIFVRGQLKVVVGQEPVYGPGTMSWHLAISHPKRLPAHGEITKARYDLLPENLTMVMMWPPKGQYVDVHRDHTLHLYEFLPDAALVDPNAIKVLEL